MRRYNGELTEEGEFEGSALGAGVKVDLHDTPTSEMELCERPVTAAVRKARERRIKQGKAWAKNKALVKSEVEADLLEGKGEGVRPQMEAVQKRLARELMARTATRKDMGELSIWDIAAMLKTCRENLAVVTGQSFNEMKVVTEMPMEEEE